MKVAIIGGGNMGVTYAKAFVRAGLLVPNDILIVEKLEEKRLQLQKENIGNVIDDITSDIANYDVLIAAVKPQDFAVMAKQLVHDMKPSQLVLSIMAGIPMSVIATQLNGHANIARAMPNTPAQLGVGISAFVVNDNVTETNIALVKKMLATTGEAIFMKDENLIDAVTAMSGSGPAYFYYIIKNMIEAGVKIGLDEATSAQLAKETMLGSYQMMKNSSLNLDQMIAMVASKGGTTEAALNTLNELHVGENIQKAIQAAEHRAKELSKA
jgi:pyrroline-5-carboxylate reductase